MNTDTIAAIATGMTPSGIGIIRVSGEDAFSIASSVFRRKNNKPLTEYEDHKAYFGYIYDNDRVLDEVILLVFKGPNSYSGEDTVEIQCHGGILVMNRILELCINSGARCAKPGEFTKRAFLNGKMDLSEAEAVMDVISAKSEYALESSLSQLKGSLGNAITSVREALLNELAFIEAALDDPEHYSLDGYGDELAPKIEEQKNAVRKLLSTAEHGRYIEEGIATVILGKPNAGKSSLLNRLTGKERAIVTDVPGTTRDVLKETISIGGAALKLVDTAGIRKASDTVEKIGIDLAREEASNADLVLYVADSSVQMDENDKEILELVKDKKVIVLLNKSDLPPVTTADDIKKVCEYPYIEISAAEGSGIEELKEKIKQMFFNGEISFNDEVFITNVRHKNALEETLSSLENVTEAIECGIPEDVYAIDIYGAVNTLDSIIGGNISEDLVDTIFEKFCMGK